MRKIQLKTAVTMLVGLAACGEVQSVAPPDSKSGEPAAGCDDLAPFGPPTPIAGLSTAGIEDTPRLSDDELTVYFDGRLGTDANLNIYVAKRGRVTDGFGAPVRLDTVSDTTFDDWHPSISRDGLEIFLESSKDGTSHVYVATRTTALAAFSAPSVADRVNGGDAFQPFLTADGTELWFTSTRPGGLGQTDIFHAIKAGEVLDAPIAEVELSSAAWESTPMLSADKLTVYFSSDRPGGAGMVDIWRSHRTSVQDGFPAPKVVPELSSSANEFPGWLSPDNCRIYLTSSRSGNPDIYMATRTRRDDVGWSSVGN
jgi:Tol biopolymer transport system component